MFSQHYKTYKKLKDKLDKQEAIMNQAVTILDILIYPDKPKNSYGEIPFGAFPSITHTTVERLAKHIEILANIANTYHTKHYCNDDGTIKNSCLNKIVRLSLNEFALYSALPISLENLHTLVESVLVIAKKQHTNVHLLLSSLSVLTKDKKLLNVSLYVQCGEDSKVEVFSKGRASAIDMNYQTKTLYSQENSDAVLISLSNHPLCNKRLEAVAKEFSNQAILVNRNDKISIYGVKHGKREEISLNHTGFKDLPFPGLGEEPSFVKLSELQPNLRNIIRRTHLPMPNISEYIASEQGMIISSNPVLTITTPGGAEIREAVDVCLDFEYAHASTLMINNAVRDTSPHDELLLYTLIK